MRSESDLIAVLPAEIRSDLQQIHSTLSQAGYECYLVGGCVRDLILARHSPGDYDLASNAPPEIALRLFPRSIPTGLQHGTITILLNKRPYELTTYRRESEYSDARRPDAIAYAQTLAEDLSRRDFSMNALALDLQSGVLIDYYNGLQDLQAGRIRAIGSARERFCEDGLRPVRACRF
ncbi:MAG: hypothetical protein KDK39_19555, partial [Leptospiraceae bacterium]|nr:hypothetical protein [Leptospiraceae bacterium]